jgi:hypothetical protein
LAIASSRNAAPNSASGPPARSGTIWSRATPSTNVACGLYFVIKDHPFAGGNKRIGSFLFLLYLNRNGLLAKPDGTPLFADNALVATALLVAESDPGQKELLIRLILNLLQVGGE